MKKILPILLTVISFMPLYGQNSHYDRPDYGKYKLILIGEPHYIIEKNEIELNIIKDISYKVKKNIVIFLEYPLSMNYFIDKLFQDNDSNALKNYLLNCQNNSTDSLNSKNKLLFRTIYNIYQINNNTRKISIKCIDNEFKLRPILFSLQTILNKYEISDSIIQKDRMIIENLINKCKYSEKDIQLFKDNVISSYFKNRNSYSSSITNDCDLKYISNMFENFVTMDTYSEQRDSLLAKNIVSDFNDNILYIAILGSAHVNKFYNKRMDISGNRKSVGYILNNTLESPYRHSIYSINISICNIKTPNATLNYESKLLFLTNAEINKLSLTNGNVNYIITSKKEFKFAYKAYNLIIYIKNGTSNLYDI